MLRKQRVLLAAVATLAVAGSAVLIWQNRPQATAGSSNTQSPISNPESLPLHPVVKQIVKDGVATPYLKLNYIIKELPTDLAQHDIQALIAFIIAAKPQSFSDGEWGSLTNDIQEALSAQDAPNPEVAKALIGTFRDEKQPRMMRDYALQHVGGFAIYLVHTAHNRGGKLPPFFGDLTGELLAAARDTANSWAGTSLNLLDGLLRAAEHCSVVVPGVTAESLTALAIPAAKDATAPLNTRLPALQLASRRRSPEAPILARAILTDPSSSLMLVQSAAAVLGQQGNEGDLKLLKARLAVADSHASVALNQAIGKLSQR